MKPGVKFYEKKKFTEVPFPSFLPLQSYFQIKQFPDVYNYYDGYLQGNNNLVFLRFSKNFKYFKDT